MRLRRRAARAGRSSVLQAAMLPDVPHLSTPDPATLRPQTLCAARQQDAGGARHLAAAPELIGNVDEVTDARFVRGSAGAPAVLALATNAPAVRLFDLATMACTATLRGHTEAVLALDALPARCGPQHRV